MGRKTGKEKLPARKVTSGSSSTSSASFTSSVMTRRACPACPAKRERHLRKIQMLAQAVEINNRMDKARRDAANTMRLLSEWSREFLVSGKNQQHLAALVRNDKTQRLKVAALRKNYLRSKACSARGSWNQA